jgi:NADPH:quinone reductase-like Zn-dependent oxidoreductase
LDLLVASGRFYAGVPNLPYVPGVEGIGEVVEAESVPVGSRVRFETRAGYSGNGSLAELAVADEESLQALPDHPADAVAAALGVSGLAGWLSLSWRAVLRPGERVLVLGSTGAVGQVAIQAARILGASRVVAATRDATSASMLQRLGAHEVVVLEDRPAAELAEQFRTAAGGPVHVTVDPIWGQAALAALSASAPGGRLVHLGQSAAHEIALASGLLRGQMLSVLGYTNLLVPQGIRHEAYLTMLGRAAAGDLKVETEEVALSGVTHAWLRQGSAPRRKLVVLPQWT